VLAALLGLGFGLLQTINRPDASPALLAFGQAEPTAIVASTASLTGPAPAQLLANSPSSTYATVDEAPREIHASARVIEPSYTVQAGDTLGQIAARFGTTVQRIQALNNVADPTALRIGTRLAIPPPL
jgi:LysM repeat protein